LVPRGEWHYVPISRDIALLAAVQAPSSVHSRSVTYHYCNTIPRNSEKIFLGTENAYPNGTSIAPGWQRDIVPSQLASRRGRVSVEKQRPQTEGLSPYHRMIAGCSKP
jgi:hypothetical protein